MSTDRIPAEIQKPLGGVHPEVIEGNRTPKRAFLRSTCETWGVYGGPAWQLPNNWKKEIQKPETLSDIRNREVRRLVERVVLRKLDGHWVSGAGSIDSEKVEATLKEDGYRFLGDERFEDGDVGYIVEYYGQVNALDDARGLVERFKAERARTK